MAVQNRIDVEVCNLRLHTAVCQGKKRTTVLMAQKFGHGPLRYYQTSQSIPALRAKQCMPTRKFDCQAEPGF